MIMENEITKGDWFIDIKESGVNKHGAKFLTISSNIGKAACKGIADVYESEANAKLIVCAPEMLQMLNKVKDLFTKRQMPNEHEINMFSVNISELIEKAT